MTSYVGSAIKITSALLEVKLLTWLEVNYSLEVKTTFECNFWLFITASFFNLLYFLYSVVLKKYRLFREVRPDETQHHNHQVTPKVKIEYFQKIAALGQRWVKNSKGGGSIPKS